MKKILIVASILLILWLDISGFSFADVKKVESSDFHHAWGKQLKELGVKELKINTTSIWSQLGYEGELSEGSSILRVSSCFFDCELEYALIEVEEFEAELLSYAKIVFEDSKYYVYVKEEMFKSITYQEYSLLLDYITKSYITQNKKALELKKEKDKRKEKIKESWLKGSSE